MARGGRKVSELGLYHVTQRGVAKSDIFFDDSDRVRFDKYVEDEVSKEFKIHCHTQMDNHFHLLIQADSLAIMSEKMRIILIRYVKYVNHKYKRDGTLFKGRYNSYPIKDRNHFKNSIIYILRNPLEKGIFDIENYRWSSIRDYYSGNKTFVSTALVEKVFNNRANLIAEIKKKGILPYIQDSRRGSVEYGESEKKRIIKYVRKEYNTFNPSVLPFEKRVEIAIAIRKKIPDITIARISECLKLDYRTVKKYTS